MEQRVTEAQLHKPLPTHTQPLELQPPKALWPGEPEDPVKMEREQECWEQQQASKFQDMTITSESVHQERRKRQSSTGAQL